MSRIPEETIVAIKSASDIVSFIGEYVQDLKITGKNYKARCPFHDEKTPSFVVSPERQTFRCFGCGESGNIISFLMKIERLTFPQAIKQLASRVGITIEKTAGDEAQLDEREKLYQINLWALKWFQGQLNERNGSEARHYLESRKFMSKSIEDFQLGFAPSSWDALMKAGQSQGFSSQDLIDSGLLVQRDTQDKVYDRFRNRVIFPISDSRARVVGFGGRILEGDGVKYVNSPESSIFKKSQNLYGLYQASRSLRKSRTAVLLEGYTDVIMAHQYGFDNALAVLGTALNADHARLLKRWVDRVILIFDGDEAGRLAAWRSLPFLMAADLEVFFASLPEDQDPCEFLETQGTLAFQNILDHSLDPIDLAFTKLTENSHPDEVSRTIRMLTPVINSIPSPIRRELYLKKISDLSGLKLQTLLGEVKPSDPVVPENKVTQAPALDDEASMPKEELGLLAFLFMQPQRASELFEALEEVQITHPRINRMMVKIFGCLEDDPSKTADYLEALFQDEDEIKLITHCRDAFFNEPERLLNDCLRHMKKKQIRLYENLARQARDAKDHDSSREYERKRYLLTQALKSSRPTNILKNA